MPIVVGGLRMRIRVRLVAQAPQDDAGVILVAGNHVRQHLCVIIGGRPAIGVFASFADADGGRFGDHDDALAVAQGQHFLRIGIMAGAEGVGVQPVEEVDVRYVQALVKPAPVEEGILVLARPMEVEGLAVDEKTAAVYLDFADAERLAVLILTEADTRGVEVRHAGSGFPEMRICHMHFAGRTRAAGDDLPVCIQHIQRHVTLAVGRDGVAHCAIHRRNKRHIGNIIRRGGVQADGAVQPGIVKEVEIRQVDALRMLVLFARLDGGDAGVIRAEERRAALVADREGVVADGVVHLDFQQGSLTGVEDVGHVRLEGQKAAAMGAEQLTIKENASVMGDGVEAEHQALTFEQRWHGDAAAIPRQTDMTAEFGVSGLVVVGRGNSDGLPRRVGLETEVPYAGEVENGAGCVGLRCEHGEASFFAWYYSGRKKTA